MPKLRVHNFAVSLDGTPPGLAKPREPSRRGGERLHEWVFATRYGRRMIGEEGGDEGLDNEFLERGDVGIGATIMGRNMFGPIRGPWTDDEWKGWWGTSRPTTTRCSCSPTIRARRSRWMAAPRSTS